MSREENEATLRRVVVRQAVEITRVRDRLAGCSEARNAAERGLAKLHKELATVRETMAKAIGETETTRRERDEAQAEARRLQGLADNDAEMDEEGRNLDDWRERANAFEDEAKRLKQQRNDANEGQDELVASKTALERRMDEATKILEQALEAGGLDTCRKVRQALAILGQGGGG